jgi:glycosyltransferase involved in cell wall biosynthesis
MPALHVAQINFLAASADLRPDDVFRSWHSLVDIAEAAASDEVRVSVVQAAGYEARAARNGIDYRFVDVSQARSVEQRVARIATVIRELGVDLLHVHGLSFARNACALSQQLLALPLILQDHANGLPRWWRRPAWRRWYASASAVAFTSVEQAKPFFTAGLFDASMRIVAIAESSSRFVPGNRLQARATRGLYGDPCVLWIGHLNANKDPLSVLEGMALTAANLPGLQLWCAFGTAPLLHSVKQRIANDPRLTGRVHLLGKVEHAQVERLMQSADLFVSGSLAEGSGYALLEALACGTVPVVTDIPAFRALTDNGRVGFLWPCGDAESLAAMLTLAAAKRPTPTQVRAHFDANLSFNALQRRWANAYTSVLDEHRQNPQ